MAARVPAVTLLKAKAKARPMPSLPSRRRFAKNMAAVSGAMTLGDLGCQAMEWWGSDEEFVWDHKRSMRMGVTGAFVVTPMSFTWNIVAEWWAPGASWQAICKKQLVAVGATVPMLYAQFFSLIMQEEGKTIEDFHQKVDRDYFPTFRAGLFYWPFVGVVNFKYVPVVNRPAASSLAGLFWSIYLSHRANRGVGVEELDSDVKQPGTLGTAAVMHPLETAAVKTTVVTSPAEVGGGVSGSSEVSGVDVVGGAAGVRLKADGSVVKIVAGAGTGAGADVNGVSDGDKKGTGGGGGGDAPPGRTRRERNVVRRTTVVSY